MIALRLSKRCGATDLIDVNEWKTPDARVQRVKNLADGRGARLSRMPGFLGRRHRSPTVSKEIESALVLVSMCRNGPSGYSRMLSFIPGSKMKVATTGRFMEGHGSRRR